MEKIGRMTIRWVEIRMFRTLFQGVRVARVHWKTSSPCLTLIMSRCIRTRVTTFVGGRGEMVAGQVVRKAAGEPLCLR